MLNKVFCIDPPGLPDSARFYVNRREVRLEGLSVPLFTDLLSLLSSVRGLKVIFGVVTYCGTLKRIPLGADFEAFTRILTTKKQFRRV